MGTAPSNTGLKGQWGVSDPQSPTADTGSDQQANEFKAAFQQAQGSINGHLQYTSTNAEAAAHAALAGRRDSLYGAFQTAQGKIDRSDPSKAQGDIDRVLADARALDGDATTLHQETEQAKQEWDSKQGSSDEAVHHIEELEAWEDAQAAALRGQADAIRGHTNERRWREACTALDSLLPALQPVYQEYERQRDAKPQYEQQAAEQTARLEPLKAAERPSQPITAKAGEADAALQEAKAKADAKDFVAGLEGLGKAGGTVDELTTLVDDPQRAQYLAATPPGQAVSEPQPEPAFKTLEADWAAIADASSRAQPLADGGDYAGANQALADGTSKRDAFQQKHDELVAQQQAYEAASSGLQPRLQAVATLDPAYATLQPMQQELAPAQAQMEASAQAEDFAQALTQAQDLGAKCDAIETAKAEIDAKKKGYEDGLAALQPRLQAASSCEPTYAALQPQQQALAQTQGEMEAAAQGGDYDKATASQQDLTGKLDELEAAKAEIDAKKKAYEDGLAALQPRLQEAAAATDPAYAPLQPQQQAIAQAQGEMEAAAQGGDYDKATASLQDLTAQLDAFEKAKADIDAKKKAYEEALAALQPRLQAASVSEAGYDKLQPLQQALAQAQGEMEAAAQAGDYDKASASLQDLTAKLDAYEAAKAEIDEKKKAYETALAAQQSRLQAASSSEAKYAKLQPLQAELASAQTAMEAAAQAADYDKASQLLQDLIVKLDAFEKARGELDQQEKEYDLLRTTVEPRIAEAAKKQYLNLAPKLEEIKKIQAQAATAAGAGDYAEATRLMNDASAKTDAYVVAGDKEVEPPIMGDSQGARADAMLKKLPEADQKEVKTLLDGAKSEAEKQYLLKGVAAGHTVAELKEFDKKIQGKDDTWMRNNLSVTGSSTGTGVKQQWRMSCNATATQAVKAQMDPLYALKLHEENPELDQADNTDGTKKNPKLAAEQKSMLESDYHGGVAGGGKGVATPRSGGGTGRWADDLLNNQSDSTGITYATQKDPPVADAIKTIDGGVGKGQPVPIVIGNSAGAYTHYVVVTGMTKGPPKQYTIHDPGSGQTVVRTEDQIKTGAINLSGSNRITGIEKPSAKAVPP